MKVTTENNKIYIITMDYSGFYMKPMPCQRLITLGEAIRLRQELDAAINETTITDAPSVCSVCGDEVYDADCPNCNREFE